MRQEKGKPKRYSRKGISTIVEPIRDVKKIQKIKRNLSSSPRDYCLFTVGINTAYRASELLSIRVGDVLHAQPGNTLRIWQRKTSKYRIVPLNETAVEAIHIWLAQHPKLEADQPLYISRKGGALDTATVSRMVKKWCKEANLHGNFASHSMRKTWGYHVLRNATGINKHMILPVLVRAYGHANQEQTFAYLGIQSDEVYSLYQTEI